MHLPGRDAVYGKNYALFTLPIDSTQPNQDNKAIYAEMSIYPTHTIQSILPSNYTKIPISKTDHRIKWRQRRNFKIDHIIQRQISSVGNMTTSDLTYTPIVPSFFNADEVWFPGGKNPFKEFAHGGACCVNFVFDDMDEDVNEHDTVKSLKGKGVNSLMVGVGHTLVKVSNVLALVMYVCLTMIIFSTSFVYLLILVLHQEQNARIRTSINARYQLCILLLCLHTPITIRSRCQVGILLSRI